jgi:nucleoside diphosphate kinase
MKIGRNNGRALPRELSRFQDKLDVYATDTYFLESWEDLLGEQALRELPPLSQLASLTLKPDAVVGRTIRPTIQWLTQHGFSIVAAEIIDFDRHTIRAIWQYSWNVASRDRKDIVDLLLTMTPSLYLALRGPDDASLWLSQHKGPANPRYRRPGQLRHGLGSFSTLLNFVHTSDEPADFVRELGIYFPAPSRRRIYRQISSGESLSDYADGLAAELEFRFPPHDLRLDASIARMRDEIAGRDEPGLLALLDELSAGASRDWKALFEAIESAGLRSPTWDAIVVATNLVRMDEPDLEPLLQGISSLDLPATATELG